MTTLTRTMPMVRGEKPAIFNHDGGHDQADHVHHFDDRVEGRAGSVLERVTDDIANHTGIMLGSTLAAKVAIFDVFLGVIPCAAGIGHEDGQQLPADDDPGQEGAEGLLFEQQTDDDGGENGD